MQPVTSTTSSCRSSKSACIAERPRLFRNRWGTLKSNCLTKEDPRCMVFGYAVLTWRCDTGCSKFNAALGKNLRGHLIAAGKFQELHLLSDGPDVALRTHLRRFYPQRVSLIFGHTRGKKDDRRAMRAQRQESNQFLAICYFDTTERGTPHGSSCLHTVRSCEMGFTPASYHSFAHLNIL